MSNTHSLMTGADLHANAPIVVADLPAPNIVNIDDTDSPYSALTTTDILLCDTTSADITVNLPTLAGATKPIEIKNTGSNTVYVTPASTEKIDLDTAAVNLNPMGSSAREAVRLVPAAPSWFILAGYTGP